MDAVVVADSSGAIRFWNPAAERLFGFAEAEALGDSLDLVVPERFREHRWAGYKSTMPPDRVFRRCIKTDERCR